ncbi:MAG: phage holin family protein [Marmoricola sp.]
MNDSLAHDTATTPASAAEPTLGSLVHQLSEQVPDLIRSEMRLAQAEMAEKGKRAGLGIGMFSAAGLLAFFGLATLITTAILALALVVPGWLAALIVALGLLAGAGAMAMVGKKQVEEAIPPVPERAVEGVRNDIATLKGAN